jgi:hypothetical protein
MTGTSSAAAVSGLSDFAAGLAGGAFADAAFPPLMARKTGLPDAAVLLTALADLSALGIFRPSNFKISPPPAYNVPVSRDTIRRNGFHLLAHAVGLCGRIVLRRQPYVTK